MERAHTPSEPEVSWINPVLPAGAGLAHAVLASRAIGRDVGYVVWTPPGYAAGEATTYPVVYFLHGLGGNESADAVGFSSLLLRGIGDGRLPACICVFPNGGRSFYFDGVDRMIVDELIPLVDSSYRTVGTRRGRAVAGFSMGGGGAVRLALQHPDLFCAAGSWGGGMFRDPELFLRAARSNGPALRERGFSALLVNGDRDRPDAFAPLTELFASIGIDHRLVVLADTPHNLGLYYQSAGDSMLDLLGTALADASE